MKFPIQFYFTFSIFTFFSVISWFLIKYMKYEKYICLLNKFSNLTFQKNKVLCAKILSYISILAIFFSIFKEIIYEVILFYILILNQESFLFQEEIFTFCELSTSYIFCENALKNPISEISKKLYSTFNF